MVGKQGKYKFSLYILFLLLIFNNIFLTKEHITNT